MRRALLALALLLPACATPSPHLLGAPRAEVVVDGRRYAVFHDGRSAEAVRVSLDPAWSTARTRREGRLAVRRATGCRVAPGSLRANSSVLAARIDCREPPAPDRRRPADGRP